MTRARGPTALAADLRRRGNVGASTVHVTAVDEQAAKRAKPSIMDETEAQFIVSPSCPPTTTHEEIAKYMEFSEDDIRLGFEVSAVKKEGKVYRKPNGDVAETNTKFNVLKLWYAKRELLPTLAKSARANYSRLPTEANNERSFSSAGKFMFWFWFFI
jgi:hypothetical protein